VRRRTEHYAAHLENADGYEVEIVARNGRRRRRPGRE
jgi:hypothetical protein